MPLAAGTRVGSYEIVRLLGAGGMGEVYLANDPRLGREVALKLLPLDVAADPDRRARFEREARLAAALHHPHICTIYEVGDANGQPFIAMEHVEGTTLRDRVRVDLFSLKETIDIAIQIADALDEARQRKVVHRDLKSANILLTPRGDVKILDFGLAKRVDEVRAHDATTEGGVTEAGLVIGTAAYMSPEQALGQPVDHRSDLFSFGVVLYELLTGRLPFTGKTTMELFSAILHSAPQPIPRFNDQVPDPLVRVVGKLLEKDREQRYQSAREVLTDLRKIRDEGATASVGHSTSRRPRLRIAAWAGIALVAIVVAGTWLWIATRPVADTASILVLPASVVQESPQFEKYKDALPGTLSGYLAQIDGVIIKGPPTSGDFERLHGDVAAVVRAYGGASLVAQMVVLAEGQRMRVQVRLNRTDSQVLVWQGDYDDAQQNYPALMRKIAEDVGRKLRPQAAGLTLARGLTNVDPAFQAYQDGMFYWNRYNQGSESVPFHEEADFLEANRLLESAYQLDSKFAEPAGRLAHLFLFKALETGRGTPEMVRAAAGWADRALERDPHSALAWTAKQRLLLNTSPDQAMPALRLGLKAATYAPDDGFVAGFPINRADSFIFKQAGLQEVLRLDPLYLYGHRNLGYVQVALNNSASAIEHITDVLARDPGAASVLCEPRIEALADLGRTDEARRLLDQLRGDVASGKYPASVLPLPELEILVASGNPAWAAKFTEYLKIADGTYEPLLALFARRGDRESAFRLFEATAPGGGYANFDFLATDTRIDSLRVDPRFQRHFARSRAAYAGLVAQLEEAQAAGEFPKYLEEPLRQMHALLDSHR